MRRERYDNSRIANGGTDTGTEHFGGTSQGNSAGGGNKSTFGTGHTEGTGTECERNSTTETSIGTRKKRGRPPGRSEHSHSTLGTGKTERTGETSEVEGMALEDILPPASEPTKRGRRPKGSDDEETIRSLLLIVCNTIQYSKPYLTFPDGSQIPDVPPDTLKRLWDVSDQEAQAVSVPLSRMLPNMSPRIQKIIKNSLNPVSLVIGVWAVFGTRYVQEKELITNIRKAYDAGFIDPGRENTVAGKTPSRNGTESSDKHTSEPENPIPGDNSNPPPTGPDFPSGLSTIF